MTRLIDLADWITGGPSPVQPGPAQICLAAEPVLASPAVLVRRTRAAGHLLPG
ncbi:MAG TPA: hypothetical protein VH637_17525 [Streptosporangiaceae bacterium]